LDIADWRDEIDRLDEELVKLLNERLKCCIEIGHIKKDTGLAVYSPDREKQVIEHVTGINMGPLDAEAMQRLFERIIDEARRAERLITEPEAASSEELKPVTAE
jgi:chorismate mutase